MLRSAPSVLFSLWMARRARSSGVCPLLSSLGGRGGLIGWLSAHGCHRQRCIMSRRPGQVEGEVVTLGPLLQMPAAAASTVVLSAHKARATCSALAAALTRADGLSFLIFARGTGALSFLISSSRLKLCLWHLTFGLVLFATCLSSNNFFSKDISSSYAN